MKKITLTFVAALTIAFTSLAQPGNNGNGNGNGSNEASATHDIQISVGTHALIDIVGSNGIDIQLSPEAPETAGEALSFENAIDQSLWLNYSSIVGTDQSNKITAAYSGDLPGGLALVLSVGEDAGNGTGVLGTDNVSEMTLTGSPQDVLKNIKNCYTGTGTGSGRQLTYRLEQAAGTAYEDISTESSTLTITYTITEE